MNVPEQVSDWNSKGENSERVNSEDEPQYGRTALYFAVANARLDICRLLIQIGADPNAGEEVSKLRIEGRCRLIRHHHIGLCSSSLCC